MYRLSLRYVPMTGWSRGQWRVTKCWEVDEAWGSRAVKVRCKRAGQERLILLSTSPYERGEIVVPPGILEGYLVHERMKRESRT